MIQVKREGGDRKPPCRLTGTDGNAFALIGRVKQALRDSGMPERAKEFTGRAFAAGSYDAVLQLCFEFVEVE